MTTEWPRANLVQVNLQTGFGGGEIYTCFFGQALRALERPFELIVHRQAGWWRTHDTGASRIHEVGGMAEIPALPFGRPAWLVYHTPDGGPRLAQLRQQGCGVAAIVHMPIQGRASSHFRDYDRLFAVSAYVRDGLVAEGFAQTHPEPLYGVAHLERSAATAAVVAQTRFAWDTRKLRDVLLSWVHPLWRACLPRRVFARRAGLTLGVVSRLTPIKQFPALFALLAPVLAEFPGVHLEIFGSGGYASVRDTQAALAPLGARVRWWGQQDDVRAVYPLLDYLLTGLPEKEALGLNVIEAQICGTPVLAPDAPPFTEIVAQARSGYLYPDPRTDRAAGFRALLSDIISGRLPHPEPKLASEHLARFSEAAFRERVARALAALEASHRTLRA
jgi:glycosyltransferase involved in cell wall biosynthesis